MSARSTHRIERALLAAALAWLAPEAACACDADFVPTSSTLRLDYDPFAFTRTVGRLTFEATNRGAAACAIDLALLDATRVAVPQADVGGTGVVITLSGGAGDALLAPTGVPGVWRVMLDPGRRTRLAIEGVVTQDAVATSGEHATDLTLEMRDAGGTIASTAVPVRLVLAAIPRAQMNIVGAAATFGEGTSIAQVDFGTMQANAERRVFLQVRANTSARLTIDSENHGRLLRPDSPPDEKGIAYTARLVDDPVDLTRHWERVIEPPRTFAGTSLPLSLTLGNVGAHVAGTYSDVLTLELSAL